MDFPHLPTRSYQTLRHTIHSGDILLCSGNSFFSTLIQQATGSMWSHVAFILKLDAIDRIMVLESVEGVGVRTVPLSNYVRDYDGTGNGYPGKIMIARHKKVQQQNITKLSQFAVDLLGHHYHSEEIARIAARIVLNPSGTIKIDHHRHKNKDFICSEYAHICFESIGINIEYNNLGFIAPVDFARCPEVEGISFVEVEKEGISSAA